MAPMRAFSILQRLPKITKMTPDDLLSLTMVLSELLGNTEQNTLSFFKFVIFVEIRRKNDFDDNLANYKGHIIER